MRARTRWFLLDKHLDIIAKHSGTHQPSKRKFTCSLLQSSCSGGLRRLCQARWRQRIGSTVYTRPALSTISNTAGLDIALILRSAPPSSSPAIGGTVGDPSPCDDEPGTFCPHREGVISCHSRGGQNSSTLPSRNRTSLFMTDSRARHGFVGLHSMFVDIRLPTHTPVCAIRPLPPVYSVA